MADPQQALAAQFANIKHRVGQLLTELAAHPGV